MFKTPAIKVDELFLNDQIISIENDKNSFFKISLIETSNKCLKLSKFTEGSPSGSVNIPFDQITEPQICSTELEFSVKGPINFKDLNVKEVNILTAFKFKASFESGFDSDVKAFSSFLEHCSQSIAIENTLESTITLGRSSPRLNDKKEDTATDDFIKRIPKVKKRSPLNSPFVKITADEFSKKEVLSQTNAKISDSAKRPCQTIDLELDKIENNNGNEKNRIPFMFNLNPLTEEEQRCFLNSGQILYGIE